MKLNTSESNLVFLETLPLSSGLERVADPKASILIYDRRLEKISREFRAWARKYPHRYAVTSGEKLKDLKSFPAHFGKLAALAEGLSPRSMTVVAAGGGSVGDFAGFFASVYKRGVRLVHVPSTWLAAIDSSHGGKTALNWKNAKNQLGSFYPAERVVLVQSLLLHQPEERIRDAMAELGKIALIDGGTWVHRLERTRLVDGDLLWAFLRPAIRAKMKVVEQDPKEKTGVRQVLNLGHTTGHVFESVYGWSHGASIAQGLFFTLRWSEHWGLMSPGDAGRVRALLVGRLGLGESIGHRKISASLFRTRLLQDKKRTKTGEVTFITVRKVGNAERISISVDELIREAKRQGWVGA